jgi:hypothetical protein
VKCDPRDAVAVRPTRRDLLGATAVGLAATAGCSSLPFLGDDGDDAWPLRTWATPADAVPSGEGYQTGYTSLAARREFADSLGEGALTTGDADAELSPFGVGEDATDDVVELGSATHVFLGSYGTDSVVSAAPDRFSEQGEHRGYRLLSADGVGLGVTDGAIVHVDVSRVPDAPDPLSTVRSVVDVGEGETDTVVDADEDFAAALDPVSGTDAASVSMVSGLLGASGLVSFGVGLTLGSDTTDATLAFVFEDGDAASEETAGRFGSQALPDAFSSPSYSTEGRVVTATAEASTADLGGGGEEASRTPQASFAFEYDEPAREVTITHEGGDTFNDENAAALRVVGADGQQSFDLPVTAGDSVTVSVDPGATVRVVWEAPGGDRTATVASFDVPD